MVIVFKIDRYVCFFHGTLSYMEKSNFIFSEYRKCNMQATEFGGLSSCYRVVEIFGLIFAAHSILIKIYNVAVDECVNNNNTRRLSTRAFLYLTQQRHAPHDG